MARTKTGFKAPKGSFFRETAKDRQWKEAYQKAVNEEGLSDAEANMKANEIVFGKRFRSFPAHVTKIRIRDD